MKNQIKQYFSKHKAQGTNPSNLPANIAAVAPLVNSNSAPGEPHKKFKNRFQGVFQKEDVALFLNNCKKKKPTTQQPKCKPKKVVVPPAAPPNSLMQTDIRAFASLPSRPQFPPPKPRSKPQPQPELPIQIKEELPQLDGIGEGDLPSLRCAPHRACALPEDPGSIVDVNGRLRRCLFDCTCQRPIAIFTEFDGCDLVLYTKSQVTDMVWTKLVKEKTPMEQERFTTAVNSDSIVDLLGLQREPDRECEVRLL